MTDQSKDPYGVPTGVVPRLNPATLRPYAPDHPDGLKTLPDFGVHGAAIQQTVDDWLLMERKARAWDDIVMFSKQSGSTADAIAGRLLDLATGQVQEPSHVR